MGATMGAQKLWFLDFVSLRVLVLCCLEGKHCMVCGGQSVHYDRFWLFEVFHGFSPVVEVKSHLSKHPF